MRTVDFLTAPKEMDLYCFEICEYADEYVCVPIKDLGLSVESITIDIDNSWDAIRLANKIMLDKNKGRTFTLVGVKHN